MKSIHLVSRGRLLLGIGLVVLLAFVTLLGNLLTDDRAPVDEGEPPEDEEIEVVFQEETDPPADVGEEGFSGMRLDRDRARSEQVDILQGIVSNPDAGEDARAQAGDRLIEISDRLAMEAEAEQLIISSAGFADVLVYVMQDNALVLVKEDTLEDQEVSQIASMVSRVTGLSWEDISVREVS